MKTLSKISLQIKVTVVMTVVLSVTFVVMVSKFGFTNF